jgi:hypothetical protein
MTIQEKETAADHDNSQAMHAQVQINESQLQELLDAAEEGLDACLDYLDSFHVEGIRFACVDDLIDAVQVCREEDVRGRAVVLRMLQGSRLFTNAPTPVVLTATAIDKLIKRLEWRPDSLEQLMLLYDMYDLKFDSLDELAKKTTILCKRGTKQQISIEDVIKQTLGKQLQAGHNVQDEALIQQEKIEGRQSTQSSRAQVFSDADEKPFG